MNPLKTLNRYRMQALLADLAVVLLGIGTIFVFFQARNWVIPSLILLLLFYALIAAPMEKRYAKAFVAINLQLSASKSLGTVWLQHDQKLSRKDLEQSGLFPLPPGKNGALSKIAVGNNRVRVEEISSFYQVDRTVNRHGVSLIRGILYTFQDAADPQADIACVASGVFPEEVEIPFYQGQGLVKSADRLPGSTASLFSAGEHCPTSLQTQIQQCMRAGGAGNKILRIKGGTVYLLEVGKTLDLDVPIFGTPSIKTLESDRIPALAEMLQIFPQQESSLHKT